MSAREGQERRVPPVLIVLAWLWVGVPFAYGCGSCCSSCRRCSGADAAAAAPVRTCRCATPAAPISPRTRRRSGVIARAVGRLPG
ncbi:hypothetical protein ACFPM0_35990 [Pseudonocardia sulfidoxydans]|uniref:MFS transporter small subunit n=1 Tax=Pseudonocardia sulfidoxydans TaxID=54011 RepID=UPI00360BB60E